MSEHQIKLDWKRKSEIFTYEVYNRNHLITFQNGEQIHASSSTEFFGTANCVDPEQTLVASLASCHMLTFLAICSKKGYRVDTYSDEARGRMDLNEEGKQALIQIDLYPRVSFSGIKIPAADQIQSLHESAHRNCFIAHSVKSKVLIHPVQ
jgi:organic hydroperoxide reductase OsmC/OhrA